MVRRELAVGIFGAWCVACGSSRSDAGAPGSGATSSGAAGGGATGGAGGVAGSGGSVAGAGAQSGSGGVTSGSGGVAGGSAGSGGAAGAGGAAGSGAGMPGACPGTTNHAGGERIRRRFAVTSEGVRAWVGFYDTTLDLECAFSAAPDGSSRCLPAVRSISDEYFTDAACSEPAYTLGAVDRCTPAPYLRKHVPAQGCGMPSRYELYEIGETVPPGGTIYTREGAGGTCTELSAPPDVPLYRPGAAVDVTPFMEGTRTTVQGAGRIGESVWTTTDGLRQLAGWVDTARGTACHFQRVRDETVRCVPVGGGRINDTFSDAACTVHALEVLPSCDGSLPTLATLYPERCAGDGVYEHYTLGAELTGPLYYGGGDNPTCTEQAPQEGARAFSVTPIAPSEFLEVSTRVEMSAPGRLKPRYKTTADGGCWFDDFWDSELMTPCWFTRTARNEYRCLPGSYVSTVTLYLDSDCTQQVVGYDAAACGSPVPRFVATTASDPPECAEPLAPLETAPLEGPVYRMTAGTCTLVPDSSSMVLVTPVDLARFVAGTVMVE